MIFLSYCWTDDKLANKIDNIFSESGIILKRDRRDLKYKQSIKDFMDSIRDSDFVIMIISNDYLHSKNCLYEVLEFIKNKDFKNKIIPIICSESNVFDVEKRIEYQQFWTDKINKLNVLLEGIDPTKAISILTHQKEYKNVESEILDFLSVICDMNNIVVKDQNFTEHQFSEIAKYINIEDLKSRKLVVNIELEKSANISISDITESITEDYNVIAIKYKKDNRSSILINAHKKKEDVGKEIIEKHDLKNFKIFECFYYEEAYYIAGKRKTEEYNWKTVIWWGHASYGYVEDIRQAGIYSPEDVDRIVRAHKMIDKSQLAISCEYVDKINVPIIPVDSDYSRDLVRDRSKIIGNPDWKDNDGFEK